RVGSRHDRANRIGAPRAELDAGCALHLRYRSLLPRQTVHERVHERHEGGCRGQRRPCRVQAAADEQDAGVPHEPRLSVHRRQDGTVPTRPPSPVPRGLNTISPGHLDSVYLPQPRRRDRPRSSRRTEPPPDSAGGQGAVNGPMSVGSAGGTTTPTAAPPSSRSPITMSPPRRTRWPCSSTASAAATNGPAPLDAVTRAGGATRQANTRRASALSSSASRVAAPTHHPGPPGA